MYFSHLFIHFGVLPSSDNQLLGRSSGNTGPYWLLPSWAASFPALPTSTCPSISKWCMALVRDLPAMLARHCWLGGARNGSLKANAFRGACSSFGPEHRCHNNVFDVHYSIRVTCPYRGMLILINSLCLCLWQFALGTS